MSSSHCFCYDCLDSDPDICLILIWVWRSFCFSGVRHAGICTALYIFSEINVNKLCLLSLFFQIVISSTKGNAWVAVITTVFSIFTCLNYSLLWFHCDLLLVALAMNAACIIKNNIKEFRIREKYTISTLKQKVWGYKHLNGVYFWVWTATFKP